MICPEMAFACMTLEPAAEAIDEGTYEGKVTYSPKFSSKPVYKDYEGVPYIFVKGRDGIRIHIGNGGKDSTGCILVGQKFSVPSLFNSDNNNWLIDPDLILLNSTIAYRGLMERLKKANVKEFTITVQGLITFHNDK
jgi:hypothetical protein